MRTIDLAPGRQTRVDLKRRVKPELVQDEIFTTLGYQPSDKQHQFHNAGEFDVHYGGAAGGGKTKALVMDDLADAMTYPGIRIGAFRRTYDELAESFFPELQAIGYADELGARWNQQEHELRFANGSLIRYRYLESVLDATRRQGGAYQKVTIDERTLIDPAAVSILVDERVRVGSRISVPVIGIRSSSNPGGAGHAAVKARYVDATEYGKNTYVDDQGRSVRFIPAKVSDNPHVERYDPGYIRRLDAIPDPARRAAMRDGNWDTFAGQVFSEWNHDRHVVHPFNLPVQWPRYAGIDHGYRAPWCVEWGAVDSDGRLWVYRERYEVEIGERQQAQRILTDEAEDIGAPVTLRAADPSMWAKKGAAQPIAATYMTQGCAVVQATNDRLSGWQRIHTYLAEGPACDHHRALGWTTCPMLHVFENCTNLIRTLPALPYDPRGGEDANTHAEDHAPDALRYLVMVLPDPQAGTLDASSHRGAMTTLMTEDAPQIPSPKQWDDDDRPSKSGSVLSMNF